VISFGMWQRRFASDPRVVGETIRVNGQPVAIVGVAPRGFFGTQVGTSPDLWMPIRTITGPMARLLQMRSAMFLSTMGRLRPGVTREQAADSMSTLWRSLPSAGGGPAVQMQQQPMLLLPSTEALSSLQRQFAEPLWALMGLVALVLLIVCGNVSALLIVRATARRREIATRAALGASRARILRPLLIEGLLLSGAGLALGVVGAYWGVERLIAFLPANRFVLDIEPSGTVLAFSVTISVLVAVLLAVLPATQVMRLDLRTVLTSETTNVTAGGHRFGMRQLLVLSQVVFSVILLIGAGLFMRSLDALHAAESGVDVDEILQLTIDPNSAGYAPAEAARFFDRVGDAVSQQPGVGRVAFMSFPLLGTSRAGDNFFPAGHVPRPGEYDTSLFNFVSPDLFITLGIPVVAGREFTDRDDADAPRVAVVNEAYARRFFGTGNPLGQRIGNGGEPQFEIVGVVGASKFSNMREDSPLMVFRPLAQNAFSSERTLYVRTAGSPAGLVDSVRTAVRRLDSLVALYDVKTFSEQMDETLVQERLIATLSAWFGGLALFMAAMGLYGLIHYTVVRRRREFGIRLALGASSRNVAGLALAESMMLVGAGIALGAGASIPLARAFRTLLFGVSPSDYTILIGAAGVMIAVAIAAGWLPAWRAARVDPLQTLRIN
jgi:predicted permease